MYLRMLAGCLRIGGTLALGLLLQRAAASAYKARPHTRTVGGTQNKSRHATTPHAGKHACVTGARHVAPPKRGRGERACAANRARACACTHGVRVRARANPPTQRQASCASPAGPGVCTGSKCTCICAWARQVWRAWCAGAAWDESVRCAMCDVRCATQAQRKENEVREC